MSYSFDRYERQRRQTYGASTRRSALGYWIPLALTVTVATAGLVAWIWSERSDGDDEDYDKRAEGPPPGYGNVEAGRPPQGYGNEGPGDLPYASGAESSRMEDESLMARMSGAIRRTPSPQQLFDGASRRVVAGVTAAGAVVGGALSSIREEDRGDFEDHSRWSEEAETRPAGVAAPEAPGARAVEPSRPAVQSSQGAVKASNKKKTVAIVVSADTQYDSHDEAVSYLQEHAVGSTVEYQLAYEANSSFQSILSHLPHHIDFESRVLVLIYAPHLKQHPLSKNPQSSQTAPSITSSYSNIGHEDAESHSGEVEKPLASISPDPMSSPSKSKMFDTIYSQAQALVEKDTMIMPFTTPSGHVHLLRHLGPEVVYIQESLSGSGGDAITNISSWVGQIVLVVGDRGGHGGLVDSEDERGHSGAETKDDWWQNDPRIGLGKGVEVVEGLRVGEDWRRRVGGHD